MTDRLETGMAKLSALRKAHMGRTVTYVAGNDEIETTATLGRTIFHLTDESGFEMRVVTRDYLIDAADLAVGSVPFEPAAGHQIKETVGSSIYVFEVLSPGGEPEWRWTNGYQNVYRIHTKHVETE